MRTDAGWRAEDGFEDDMVGQLAQSPTPRDRACAGNASICEFGLPVAQYKDGKEWDAQLVTVMECYCGSHRGRRCNSKQAPCEVHDLMRDYPEMPITKLLMQDDKLDG